MQNYRHDPSISTARSRDADTGTQASQKPSTVPTSILPPQLPVTSFGGPSQRVQPSLAGSTTLPVLSHEDGRRGRTLRSSATWTSSTADLALIPDKDEIQDRRKFVQEYNRLAKKHGIRILVVEDFDGLETKVEEAASLRRQLETRDDMDIGLLSEQLRSAKRECAMWKGRAETAEKRVAALERFTRRLRGIKAGDAQDDYDDASSGEKGSFETMEDLHDVVEAVRELLADTA
ncbi:hypothetical protein CkaCkLH20_07548 [Colletotrichum karsti]|uniref:Uncharacterized protein n=1 Tax=Colletotrichum karsti TaxID=1095194 RepID=A0A9P6I2I8_9PEZI|nr:uncharacterized protein CkaCkLH20_07548 [Colletotrichum karsti]KAF9874854.1 hypothetical protein CkaCkLH20_07548 [Colletotrichum karsti]